MFLYNKNVLYLIILTVFFFMQLFASLTLTNSTFSLQYNLINIFILQCRWEIMEQNCFTRAYASNILSLA